MQPAAIREQQAEADGVLNIWKDHFAQLGRLRESAASQLKQNEAELATLQDARLEREGTTLDLLRQAKKLQETGQFDRAQSLVTAASNRNNDEWDAKAAADAQKQLESAIGRSVTAQRQQVKAYDQQLSANKAGTAVVEQRIAALAKESKLAASDANAITNAKKTLALEKEQTQLASARGDAYADVASQQRKIGEFLKLDNRGTVEEALRGGQAGLSALFNKERFTEAQADIGAAYAELSKFYDLARTGASNSELTTQAEAFRAALQKAGEEADTLPSAFTKDLKGLESMGDVVERLIKGRKDISANATQIKDLGTINEPLAAANLSTEGIFKNLSGAASSARTLADALANLPSVPSPGAQTAANLSSPSGESAVAVAAAASPVNQTLTVNVQGGMVDQATINQLTAAIQRQARLGLG